VADRAPDRRLGRPVDPLLEIAETLGTAAMRPQNLGVQRVGEDREDPRTGAVGLGV